MRWVRTITTRLVDTVSTPMLLKALQSKKPDAKSLITHRFKLDNVLEAYQTFEQAAETRALRIWIQGQLKWRSDRIFRSTVICGVMCDTAHNVLPARHILDLKIQTFLWEVWVLKIRKLLA